MLQNVKNTFMVETDEKDLTIDLHPIIDIDDEYYALMINEDGVTQYKDVVHEHMSYRLETLIDQINMLPLSRKGGVYCVDFVAVCVIYQYDEKINLISFGNTPVVSLTIDMKDITPSNLLRVKDDKTEETHIIVVKKLS